MLITVTTRDKEGNNRETRQLCYISENIYTLYLSEQAAWTWASCRRTFPTTPPPEISWKPGFLRHPYPNMLLPNQNLTTATSHILAITSHR